MRLRDFNTFLICFEMAKDAIMRDDARYAIDGKLDDLRAALDAVCDTRAMPINSPVPVTFHNGCCEQVRAWLNADEHMRVELIGTVTSSMQTLARWADGRLQEQLERRLQTSRMAGR